MKRFIENRSLTGVSNIILAALLAIFSSWLVNEIGALSWWALLPAGLCIITLVLYIALFLATTKRDTTMESSVNELNRQIEELLDHNTFLDDRAQMATKAMASMGRMFYENAEQLHSLAAQIIESSSYDENLWNFKKCCDRLCQTILNILNGVGVYGQDFSVSYVAKTSSLRGSLRKAKNATAYMIGYASNKVGRPSIFYPSAIPKNYYSRSLFLRARKKEPSILSNRQEIQENFYLKEPDKDKFNQYVGIPVFRDGDKMIGLIELVAYGESKIGDSYTNLQELTNTFFVPYTHLFFLMDMMEKAMLAKPKANNV